MNINDPVIIQDTDGHAVACGTVQSIDLNTKIVQVYVKYTVPKFGMQSSIIIGNITVPKFGKPGVGRNIFDVSVVKPLIPFKIGIEVDLYDSSTLFAKGVVVAKTTNPQQPLSYNVFHTKVELKEVISIPSSFVHYKLFVGECAEFLTMRLKSNSQGNNNPTKVCTCNLWAGCTCGVFKEEMKNKP